jgi:hypothetical protein
MCTILVDVFVLVQGCLALSTREFPVLRGGSTAAVAALLDHRSGGAADDE